MPRQEGIDLIAVLGRQHRAGDVSEPPARLDQRRALIEHSRLLGAAQSLIKGVYKGPFANLHTFFVVSHDDANGRIVLNDDVATIDWPDVAEQPVYARVDAVLEKAVRANGGSYVKNPLAGTFMGHTPATAHPLGGCGMGRDRSTGVVDHKGRVFDGGARAGTRDVHDGLYVCDGAIMPRSLGVINRQGETAVAVPLPLRAFTEAGATLAVSLEPPGGSPTGKPTGPVVAAGRISRL